jgi:4-amino-4-deoxychorismate lyase
MTDGAIVSWLDGAPSSFVSVDDRGLHYGDGLFETMRCRNGSIDFLELHLERLQKGIEVLCLPVSIARVRADVAAFCSELRARNVADAVVKLVVTRGTAMRGYNPATAKSASIILQAFAFVARPRQQQQGADVTLCRTRLADQPALAGIKHLNRLENVLARGEWQAQFDEGLMLSQQGHIVEGTMSNVFFIDGDASGGWTLHTPAIDRCGVAGVMRRLIIETVASRLGLDVRQSSVMTPQRTQQFSAGFLTNAIIGIWPIKSLCGRSFEMVPVTSDIQRVVDVCRDEG